MTGQKTRSVYAVRKPCAPGYEGKFCLSWQNPCMTAPAFWYFDSLQEAIDAWRRM